MRRVAFAVALQIYALLLAGMQMLGGVRTDEAKYLLNIPYPHPPLARFLLSLTSALPFQEILWRVVFSTLLVQAVWLVWRMGAGMNREQRFAAACAWLLCAAVVLQAGSIMMAPLTALQGLLFLVLLTEARRNPSRWSAWHAMAVSFLWLVSLFTAFQAFLYVPIVTVLLWKGKIPAWQRLLYLLGPVILVMLYTLSEPAVLASWVNAGNQNAGLAAGDKLTSLFQAWSIGGSVLLGLTGIAGLLLKRDWAVLLSMTLVAAFIFVSFRLYYAILFTPLFLHGTIAFFRETWKKPLPSLVPVGLITLLCLFLFPPLLTPTPARGVMRFLTAQGKTGIVLIAGTFGHEWQYEAPGPVLRYHPSLVSKADAVVCLDQEACAGMEKREGWLILHGKMMVWVKE